jgi:hypothetical protein
MVFYPVRQSTPIKNSQQSKAWAKPSTQANPNLISKQNPAKHPGSKPSKASPASDRQSKAITWARQAKKRQAKLIPDAKHQKSKANPARLKSKKAQKGPFSVSSFV